MRNTPPASSTTMPASSPYTWPKLVLGSTSPYRRALLARFGLPFDTCPPQVSEQALDGEAPASMALRLAQAKAQDVAAQLHNRHEPDPLVIGSDQVADLMGQPLGKPGNHERATRQLKAMRGQCVLFHTALCVLRPATAFAQTRLVTVRVRFRPLTDDDIEAYLRAEQPYDCAGSAKAEALGITLLAGIESDDPTALIGLPLIQTAEMMRLAGADPLSWNSSLVRARLT